MHKLVPALVAAAFIVVVVPAPSSAAGSSCPPGSSGYILWDVSTEPYGADNAVDEQGNNDGWACATPKKVGTDDNGNPFQFYNFIDNRTAAH